MVDAEIPEILHWSYYGGRLSLKTVRVTEPGMRIIYTAHPWRKQR